MREAIVHANDRADRLKYVNLKRVASMIDQGPFDAIVMMAPENVTYFAGFYNMDLRLLPERLHIVVWPKGSEPTFIVVARRARMLLPTDTYITDIRPYEGERLDSMSVLSEVLQERGLASALIGIEGRAFPGGHLLELLRHLPKLRLEDAVSFLDRIRSIKTPAEVKVQARVNRLTAEAIEIGFRASRPGDTEREIVMRVEAEFRRGGGDLITAPLLSSGGRTGLWHALANNERVEVGTILVTDFGGLMDGYYSDIARTAVMGSASSRQRDIHARVTDIKHQIVAGIRPGLTAGEVADLGRGAYARAGLEFKWLILGHGIGLALHEEPQLYSGSTEPILAGMTMMIETGYSDYPNESFHVEDLIAIGDHGAEYMTDASRHERLWELGVD
jgi:Xaa-Pro aminopeptidase